MKEPQTPGEWLVCALTEFGIQIIEDKDNFVKYE